MIITGIHIAVIGCIVGLLGITGTVIGVYVSIKVDSAVKNNEIENIKIELQKKDSQFKNLEDWIDSRFINLEKKLEEYTKALLEIKK